MLVRLGYVANALRLENCSPSRTVTFHNIEKIHGYENQISRLTTIARENLANTLRILKANVFDGILVYRFTSKLIPLCTHPKFWNWDYFSSLRNDFQKIGGLIKEHGMRVSLHPDHFTLLNSPKPEVYKSSLRDLVYHQNVLEAMELGTDAKLVIHVGGKYEDKTAAINRFKKQFNQLPPGIKKRLVLENDDRCFTAAEVLHLSREVAVPMVLDIHHHQILNHGEDLHELLPEIFATWGEERPKIHISSAKNNTSPRHHADFIEPDQAVAFLNLSTVCRRDYDIMIEAKQKDLALLKLAGDLKKQGFSMEQSRIYL